MLVRPSFELLERTKNLRGTPGAHRIDRRPEARDQRCTKRHARAGDRHGKILGYVLPDMVQAGCLVLEAIKERLACRRLPREVRKEEAECGFPGTVGACDTPSALRRFGSQADREGLGGEEHRGSENVALHRLAISQVPLDL